MLERKIWEFDHSIVCRILGLAFDEKELKKIFRKLEVNNGQKTLNNLQKWSLNASQMHGMLVQMCDDPNPGSKYLDKVLKKHFEVYRKKVNGYDQKTLCQLIEKGEEVDDIPLSALIWFAVREMNEDIKEIENRVFAAVHMREHQALKFYGLLSRKLPDNNPEEIIEQLERIQNASKKSQDRCKKLGRKVEQLRTEKESLCNQKEKLDLALGNEKRLNEKLKEDLENTGGNPTLDHQIEILRKEKESLKKKLERLENINKGLVKQSRSFEDTNQRKDPPLRKKDNHGGKEIALEKREEEQATFLSLQERKVAFVGGLYSLIPHYRREVEGLGGVFYHHCGKDSNGKKEIEKLVDKVDVVFCPVNINSHRACLCVKRACKLRNKACYFLRSSGINALKEALFEFAADDYRVRVNEAKSFN
jgi:hypothetical protein